MTTLFGPSLKPGDLGVLRRFCGWLLVPHGIDDGHYVFHARLMFRHPGQDSTAPKDISEAERDALGRVFAHWPALLAGGIDDPLLPFALDDETTICVPAAPRQLTSGYNVYLARLGPQALDRVSKLWRSAFPHPGRAAVLYGSVPPSGAEVTDRAENADFLAQIYGGLHGMALARTLVEPGRKGMAGDRPFNFASPQRNLVQAATSLEKKLANIGEFLSSPAQRVFRARDRPGTVRTQGVSTGQRWVEDVAAGGQRLSSEKVRDLAQGLFPPFGGKPISKTTRSAEQKLMLELLSLADETNTTAERAKKLLENRPAMTTVQMAEDMRKLAHHGWLMKHFGLVVEIRLRHDKVDAQHPPGWKSFDGTATPGEFVPGKVVVESASGHAMSKSDRGGLPQSQGVVQLNAEPDRFLLSQLDQMGAIHKTLQTVASYLSREAAGVPPQERVFDTSAQKMVGITLLDTSKDARLTAIKNAAMSKTTKRDGSNPQAMYAQDLTIGIRVDMQRLTPGTQTAPARRVGAWRSLMGWRVLDARINNEDVTDLLGGVDALEGLLAGSHRMVPDQGDTDGSAGQVANQVANVFAGQALFTWEGWSLAVPLPDPGGQGYGSACAELDIGRLKVRLVSAGGLPPLRVGSEYRTGLRVVYVDGFGPSLGEAVPRYTGHANAGCAGSDALGIGSAYAYPFKRFEPIAPPHVHLAERLDYNRFPQAGGHKIVLATSDDRERVQKREARYIVPPPVSLELAVAMGAFEARGPGNKPRSGLRKYCLTRSGRVPNVSNSWSELTGPGHRKDSGDTILRKALAERGPDDSFPTIPYLPDPWARRVIIGAYRHSDGEAVAFAHHDYYGDDGAAAWPDCRPLRLEVLRAQDGPPRPSLRTVFEKDEKHDTIRLHVAPGEDLDLYVWHEIRADQLEQSAVLDQVVDFLVTTEGKEVAQLLDIPILANGTREAIWFDAWQRLVRRLSRWEEMRDAPVRSQTGGQLAKGLTNLTSFGMLNPSQLVRVVNAVDRPAAPRLLWSGLPSEEVAPNFIDRFVLALPAIRLEPFEQTFRFLRRPGETDAALAGDLELDRATTQRVDFTLTWEDIGDEPGMKNPTRQKKSLSLSLDQLPAVLSALRSRAPNALPAPAKAPDDGLVLLSGVRARAPRKANEDLQGRELLAGFGDTRARIVDIEVRAHSRFAAEFNGEGSTFISLPGALRGVACPASAYPRTPDVDYVMPQYLWRDPSGAHASHERVGGCFRIWLRRPWFSSGDGEKLALVCWPPEDFYRRSLRERALSAMAELCGVNRDPPTYLEPYVTRWGVDPLWSRTGTNACLGSVPPEAFRKHVCDGVSDLTSSRAGACFPVLDLRKCESMKQRIPSYESGPSKVALVLYEPKFDEVTRRHYVDVQIDEKYAYFPFVRLSLARYQENALPGYELSELTVQEFVQLPPSRATTARMKAAGGGAATIEVWMRGASPVPIAQVDRSIRVTARLEYMPRERWEAIRPHVRGDLGMHGVAWVPLLGSSMELEQKGNEWKQRDQDRQMHHDLRGDCIHSVLIQEFEVMPVEDRTRGVACATIRKPRLVFSDRLILSTP